MLYRIQIQKQARKKLVGGPYFRLRVGDWRILFLREEILKIIFIEKLKARGDVYK